MFVDQGAHLLAVQRDVEVAEAVIAVAAAGNLLDQAEALGILDEWQGFGPRQHGVERR